MSEPGLHQDPAADLLDWWKLHGRRDLPWQREPTAYRVWVSEIMLQQTQVTTVERYYERFMAAFPDVITLADADLDQVLHRWSGLGYYARARNLHRAARTVRDEFEGAVPADFDALIGLPGIGRSTAGAILALAHGQRYPILDGNVKRVLARVFGIEGWPGQGRVARELWDLAEQCTPGERVAHYTQAIMDLGASVCTARNPSCSTCPLAARCAAHLSGATDRIPAPRPRRERPRRATVLAVMIRKDGAVLLQKRPGSGIWGGLWGFPETPSVETVAELCHQTVGTVPETVAVQESVRHSFTHFDLDMTPVRVSVGDPPDRAMDGDRWVWYKVCSPAEIGLAAPVARLLERLEGFV
jgi:A/G-specific adenine glycosylase